MTPAKTKAKEANGQAESGDEAEVTNAADEDFDMHRRFVLAVALKVTDRGEGEVFTAGNAADGEGFTADNAAGGGVDDITTAFDAVDEGDFDEATASDGAVGEAEEEQTSLASLL